MNDVTIEFASSLNNDGSFKIYHVVAGSTFSFCYNETLDSATVLLSQVSIDDRLLKLKPYEYVSVYNAQTNKRHTYLVDNFNEVEDNINEHKFSYTINLMSETKILEKIQCPNVAITHRVENGSMSRKTIYELIHQYMELFCPKAKFTDDGQTWYYKPIVEVPNGGDFYNKFNVTSADLALTAPTMRQLLTTLMQQVGCIPTVVDGVLGFLDFQAKAQPFENSYGQEDFTVNNTVNKITRSLSSDSYANTLVDMSSNVLDSNNEVICETLGFRDKDNALLRQEENLKLETKFPIYKVNEFIINFLLGKTKVGDYKLNNDDTFNVKNYFGSSDEGLDYTLYLYCNIPADGTTYSYNSTKVDLNAFCSPDIKVDQKTFTLSGLLYLVYYSEKETKWVTLKGTRITRTSTFVTGTTHRFINEELLKDLFPTLTQDDFDLLISYDGSINWYFIGTINEESFDYPITKFFTNINFTHLFFRADITKLLVENSQRQLLKTDFLEMSDTVSDIDELSKYLYGTLGYSIGSNSIVGFSQKFSVSQRKIFGPVQASYTYIENIETFLLNFLRDNNYTLEATNLPGIPSYSDGHGNETHVTISLTNSTNIYTPSGVVNFLTCFFDIKYQPLNSFNLSFVKSREEVDYSIEQFTNGANGLTDFDRLSIHQQEVVDRIGNETLVIHQRTSNFNDIQLFNNAPRYFRDDLNRDGDWNDTDEDIKHIVFKVEYSINDYYFTVSYTAAKDSVLKNYFTSIRTKYRAYQYVEYENSILRKEKDRIFVRIGEDYYNGDDRIYLPNGDYEHFIDGCIRYGTNYNGSISYAIEKGYRTYLKPNNTTGTEYITTKNDLSIVTNSNSFALIYENYDNAGMGSYISNSSFETSYADSSEALGGVPQSWVIWDDSYNESHTVCFAKYLNLYDVDNMDETIVNGVSYSLGYNTTPVLEESAQIPIISNVVLSLPSQYAFYVVDDNTNTNNLVRTFYKDFSERINHTVQFIYYRSSNTVRWTERFIKNCSFVNQENFIDIGYKEDNGISDFDADDWFNEEDHIDIPGTNIHSLGSVVTIDTTGVVPCIKVNWSGISADYIKVVGVFGGSIGGSYTEYYDLIAFKNPGNGSVKCYYITLNDTKSDYVLAKQNNVLYRKGKVKTNTLDRDIKTN